MNKHYKILIFSKDENLGALLKECLKTDIFDTETFSRADEAYEQFCTVGFDFCILDVAPEKEEITLAHAFKHQDDETRIIFLLNQGYKEDIVEAYQAGADDVMQKPFSLEILQARINAVMRRSTYEPAKPSVIYQLGIFLFNPHMQMLSVDGQVQKLTTKESDLLKILCEHANNLVERSIALQKIWKSDSYFNARSMDVYITKLRQLLKADPSICIENIHGKGYKLKTRVSNRQ